MSVLFGHPGGNPNSHHAALAHYEAGQLEAVCVPWMPSQFSLRLIARLPGFKPMATRLARRHFVPLDRAPKCQGRMGEAMRLSLRAMGCESERLSYQANDWLMRTMARAVARKSVTAVHSYEDCSLWQFQEAKRNGKACIYDMPIGYYPAWQQAEATLAKKYADWMPQDRPHGGFARPEQKKEEMALADLVLAPSSFVCTTIKDRHPAKHVVLAPYGVDLDFWSPAPRAESRHLTFLFGGQVCLRKGVPDLLEAWRRAELEDCRLLLVGSWQLAKNRQHDLPRNVEWFPACGPVQLRDFYRQADMFVLPSHFEGFSLAVLEAMACGLPVLASEVTALADTDWNNAGRLVKAGDIDGLIDTLHWVCGHRDRLQAMGKAARKLALRFTWTGYRARVRDAAAPFV
ncbi:MAG: glycosyltransferase family 4 protein [Rhizomicrobium sp.]